MLITTPYINFFPFIASFTSGTSTVTLPSGIVAGDLLLLLSGGAGQTTATGWSTVIPYNGQDFCCIGKIATGGESGTLTTGGTKADRWFCLRIANHQSGLANVSVASTTGSGSTITLGTASPSWGGDNVLVITVGDHDHAPSYTTRPAGFTSLGNAVSVYTLGCDWGWLTGSSFSPGSYIASTTGNWSGQVMVIH